MGLRVGRKKAARGKDMTLFQLIASILTVMLMMSMVYAVVSEDLACGKVGDARDCFRTEGCVVTADGCVRASADEAALTAAFCEKIKDADVCARTFGCGAAGGRGGGCGAAFGHERRP